MYRNPIERGTRYRCQMPSDFCGCEKEYESEDIVYIFDSKLFMCNKCYEKFRQIYVDNHKDSTVESFDERAYFGPGDTKDIQPLAFVKTDQPKEKTILEIIKEKEELAEVIRDQRRYARDCEAFRLDQREYMKKYMRGYNKNGDVREKMKSRLADLKERYKDSEVIDNTTPVCPRCEHQKCGKSGYVLNTTGKYQRRRCPACGYVYSDDWRN